MVEENANLNTSKKKKSAKRKIIPSKRESDSDKPPSEDNKPREKHSLLLNQPNGVSPCHHEKSKVAPKKKSSCGLKVSKLVKKQKIKNEGKKKRGDSHKEVDNETHDNEKLKPDNAKAKATNSHSHHQLKGKKLESNVEKRKNLSKSKEIYGSSQKSKKVKQKVRLTALGKREKFFKLKEEAKALELTVKEKLVCYPEKIIHSGENSFMILLPGQAVYLQGLVSVRLLVGKITIFGYMMEEHEQVNLFSFNSHALLSLRAVRGCKLRMAHHSHLTHYGISRKQLQDAIDEQTGEVVIVEIKQQVLPIVERLTVINQRQLMLPKGREHQKSLHGMLVTRENCHNYNLLNEPAEWLNLIEDIKIYHECGNAPRVIICGGKGCGKSTLFKYIVNGLLSKKGTKVQCLDIDPGQSEMSLPSCLSLTQLTEPLLGPPYTHHFDPSSPNVKQVMIGGVSPQFGLQRYIKAMTELLELSRSQPGCPLVVNTMGWTVGTGLDLILDTIRNVKPSHVIQIQGSYVKTNFRMKLHDRVVQDTLGGIHTKPGECDLYYSLIELKSLSGRKDKAATFTPKVLRELAVMLQLSDLLVAIKENPSDEEERNCKTVIVPWPEVVIHICGSKVPKQRILQVLNGNLVALCQVDPKKIESVGPDLPKHLIDDLEYGQCLGWGVIRGIDPLSKSLHIITSFPSERIGSQVNAVIMPELYLPDRFYRFFNKGDGPYYQTMYRSGAGRLKVSRQIKPGMATLGRKKGH